MGYHMAMNANQLSDLETLEAETEQQHIESLNLTDAEKAELNAE